MSPIEIRSSLLNLAAKSAHLLSGYVKIYDLKFDRTNFIEIYEAKLKRIELLKKEFNALIEKLELLAKEIEQGTVEYEFSYNLGNYVCEITNAMSCYDQRLRCLKHYQINRNFIKGAFVLLRLAREYKKAERKYLGYGKRLMALWPDVRNER
ncbi:MAG: hypothetical protein AB7E95_10790 [Kiritimatiellales bacterium]